MIVNSLKVTKKAIYIIFQVLCYVSAVILLPPAVLALLAGGIFNSLLPPLWGFLGIVGILGFVIYDIQNNFEKNIKWILIIPMVLMGIIASIPFHVEIISSGGIKYLLSEFKSASENISLTHHGFLICGPLLLTIKAFLIFVHLIMDNQSRA